MTAVELIRYICKLFLETIEFLAGAIVIWASTTEKISDKNPKPEKIIVIQTNSIGDVLMSTPLARSLRKKYKKARIDFIVLRKAEGLLANNPNIDRIYIHDPLFWRKFYKKNILGENLSLIKRVKNRSYDICIDLAGSFDSILLSTLFCAKETAGQVRRLKTGFFSYDTQKFYNSAVKTKEQHIIKQYLEIAGFSMSKCKDFKEEFFLREEFSKKAKSFIKRNKLKKNKFIVIHPGSKWPPKRWPEEYFANLIRLIYNELKLTSVIVGGRGDKTILSRIRRMSGIPETVYSGDLDFDQLFYIIEQSALFVGNDSGPAHLASTTKVPLIMLFGPTDPDKSAPLREKIKIFQDKILCWPCVLYYRRDKCQEGVNRCLRNIKPERVLVEVQRMRRR